MNDDELKPLQDDDNEEEIGALDDVDELDEDILILGKKKKAVGDDLEDLDSLADEEDEPLPEDSYDDVDLW